MDFAALTTMSSEDLTSALALDFSTLDDAALDAALDERRTEATRLFALETPSLAEVDVAEALVASIGKIEETQNSRAAEVTAAAKRFAAARATFTANAEDADADEGEDTEDADAAEDADAEDGEGGDAEDGDSDGDAGEGDGEGDGGEAAVTAAAQRGRKITTTKAKVAGRTKRPAKSAEAPVTITAAAGVPGHGAGTQMSGMVDVAAAAQGLAQTFAPWDQRQAMSLRDMGINEKIVKVPLAQFNVQKTNDLTAKSGTAAEYDTVGVAVKAHVERVNARLDAMRRGNDSLTDAMTAAMAWCSPSEVVYNWIADFKVDGLKQVPQISAPRGGLMLTEGPRLLQTTYQPSAQDDFGFGGTEEDMEAGYVKTCETIECPDFFDHRLDFDGYCWKIPILTESTFPELIADAMRVSDVAYAHKMNMRLINDILAESTARNANDVYGGTVMDSIEALVQIATKERRWWNLGRDAVLEVTLPDYALDIFKIEMQRRSGLALSDVATEQKVNAYFANHNLAVEYVSDFDERSGPSVPTADWPANIRAIMYPAGTFVQAQKDVISLSTIHDAASLSANEYTGVFY